MSNFKINQNLSEIDLLGIQLRKKKQRHTALKELADRAHWTQDMSEKVQCFTLITSTFMNQERLDKSDLRYQRNVIETIAWGLRLSANTLREQSLSRSLELKSKYLESIEDLISRYANSKENRHRLFAFSKSMRDMTNEYKNPKYSSILSDEDFLTYEGKTLIISENIGNQGASVFILTKDPRNSIACLHEDKSRILFNEYGGEESAERIIQNFYGTDGIYAMFYKDLVQKCISQYTFKMSE